MWKYNNYSINLPQTFMSSHYIDSWKLFQGKSDFERDRRRCPSIQTWSTNTLTGRIDGFHVFSSRPSVHLQSTTLTSLTCGQAERSANKQTAAAVRVGARYPSVASTPRAHHDQNDSTRPLGTSARRCPRVQMRRFTLWDFLSHCPHAHLNLHPTPGSPRKLKPPDTQKKTQVNNGNSRLSLSERFTVRCPPAASRLFTFFVRFLFSAMYMCTRHLKHYSALFFCSVALVWLKYPSKMSLTPGISIHPSSPDHTWSAKIFLHKINYYYYSPQPTAKAHLVPSSTFKDSLKAEPIYMKYKMYIRLHGI